MSQHSNTGTGILPLTPTSITGDCINCPRVNPSSTSTSNNVGDTSILIDAIGQLHDLQKEVKEIQTKQGKLMEFYDSSTKLNKTVRIVIIVLMIIPALQLICCTGVVFYLGIQQKLSDLLNWVLGGVSLLSLVELIVGGVKLFLDEKKIENLEKKVDDLSTSKNT